jgi:formylmethanofuran dehydrogenase subunit E
LTTFERDTVINFVRALEEEVGPFSTAPSTDNQSTGITKSEAAEIQLSWTQQGDLPVCEHHKVELEQTEGKEVSGTYRCTTCGEVVPS